MRVSKFFCIVAVSSCFAGCAVPVDGGVVGAGAEPPETIGTAASALTTMPLPVAYWSFDRCDGGVVLNDRGTGLNATLSNGATCGGWHHGAFGIFDGMDDRAEIANHPTLQFSGKMAVSAWVKPTSTSGSQTIVGKWYAPDAYLLLVANGQYQFSLAFSNGTRQTVSAPATAGVWTHVAGVYNGNSVKLYINGIQKDIKSASGTIQSSSRPVTIGNHPSWNAFAGSIDEVRLYDRSLSASKIARLAVPPSTLGVRGVHLYASPWVADPNDMVGADPKHWDRFNRDLNLIQDIANLNSVKTTIFSYVDDGYRSLWLDQQNNKITLLKAAAGNHVTWVFRAWPVVGTSDFAGGSSWFDRGYVFAQNLASTFDHIQNILKLQYAYIEVANEPNLPCEGFTTGSTPINNCGTFTTIGVPNKDAYNEFFRGFYYGQQSVGYNFPLIYAGLSPNIADLNAWYNDYWVRNHITNYAAKIGAHTYWLNGQRTDPNAGKSYRHIKNILAANGMSPKGIVITEFNAQRPTYPSPQSTTQINDVCQWWREEAQDAAAGWWVEQAMMYISYDEDAWLQSLYGILDDQTVPISSCQ